jgi:hypothetical protein
MSTGGKVDTVESLRAEIERLKKLGEWRGEERERLVKQHSFLGRLNIKERTRVQRMEEADALDMYVAAFLPALLPLYPNKFELAETVFEFVQPLLSARAEFLDAHDVELEDD